MYMYEMTNDILMRFPSELMLLANKYDVKKGEKRGIGGYNGVLQGEGKRD